MPSNQQRRRAARQNLERQLARRQEADQARRRWTLIASIAGSVIVVAAIIAVVAVAGGGNGHKKKTPAAAASTGATGSSSAAPSSPAGGASDVNPNATSQLISTGACGYAEAVRPTPQQKNVGLPPDPATTPTTTRTATIVTNRGTIKITLDGAMAPCNVQSIAYLAEKKFYNGSSCHRLVTSGIFVLQCGDPTGTGAGGPTYSVKDESLSRADYTTGVVAMANAGANTNGSQFFIITKDSSKGLAKNYTEIGKVTEGLNIIEKVAAGGSDNSSPNGGGKPKITLTFKSVTVDPPVSTQTAATHGVPVTEPPPSQ